MVGQELFGQLLLITLFMFLWTIYATVKIVAFVTANRTKPDNLLFYQALTFILTAGGVAILFKVYRTNFFIPFLAISSITTGLYFYFLLRKRNVGCWKQRNSHTSIIGKLIIPTLTVVIIGGVFALLVFSCFRFM
jgi:hypothetical protein